MIFEYDLTVPAAAAQDDPASVVMKLAHGIVHKLDVAFPPGCNNTVKVSICRALHQVWPLNPDGQLKANAHTISYPVWYPIEEPPYQLEAYAWSPDATYEHTVTIRLGIERREVLEPGREAIGVLGRLGQFILGRRGPGA